MNLVHKCISAGFILVFALSLQNAVAQDAELLPFWDAADDANTSSIDHDIWQSLIDVYLDSDHPSGIYRFNYAALKANEQDQTRLREYLVAMTTIDPRTYSRAEQYPYWINLYNSLTVFVVTGRYPVDSIRDIKSGLINFGPWDLELITIAGEQLTLNDIEHRILRPIWKDPRIHYAANCASIGCPNLAPTAYRSDNIEELLEQGAREYINHPRGATVDGGRLQVSSIYDWYKADFGGTNEGVIEHLLQYANPELAAALAGFSRFGDDYDWSLNAP